MYTVVIREIDALGDPFRYGRRVTSSDRLVGGLRPPLLYGLTKRQWMVLDVVVVGLGLLAASFNLRPPHSASTPAPHGAVEIILVVLACGPIVLRRKWPIPVLAVVTAATAALVAVGRAPLVLIVMIGLASYTAANRAPRRWSIPALIGAEAVLGLALTIAAERHIAGNNGVQGLLPIAAAWFLGDSIATRRRYVAGLVEQAEQRRSAEAERARQAVREERVRIARELHDVVAHSLAVMTVQAGVGRRVMAEYPEEMRSALV
jgi:signal transduction histidine kinase